MTIPWDDDSGRPTFLPYPNEPVDAETAHLIAARYTPEIRRMLTEIEETVALRSKGARWVRCWTGEQIEANWGSGTLDAILVGYVMTDERAAGGTFRSVLILIDKESGGLVMRDRSGLLR
jgi:hypothetical protein